jgi:cholesterol oxidase
VHDNLHGAERETCRLCGECNVGCNFGSKNTLDFTYLSAAARAKADLRPRCEVRSFAPRDGGGYEVAYVRHLPENEGRPVDTGSLPLERVTCDRLVLSAGVFGTPYLLLKNRAALPGLGNGLGARFSENGDLLSFVLRSRDPAAPDGFRVIEPSRGPVITSAIRVPDGLDDGGDGRGYYIEDAGFPEFVTWIAQVADGVTGVGRAAQFALRWVRHQLGFDAKTDLSGEFSDLFGSCSLEKSTLPLLGMGRDKPSGAMRLDRDGFLEIDWRVEDSQRFFERMRETMERIAAALKADFKDDPLWHLTRVITVHPLGGAPMARSAAEGVVDAWGEVFGHPGLYVADGSVMPGPVGPNPSLTIAALADRFAEGILQGHP